MLGDISSLKAWSALAQAAQGWGLTVLELWGCGTEGHGQRTWGAGLGQACGSWRAFPT